MLAKVFKSGNSTAIRIPKAINLENITALNIKKIGSNIILTPINKEDNWDNLFKGIEDFKGEIKREQLEIQERNFG